MKLEIKNAIEKYQCPGCLTDSDTECFKNNQMGGLGCGKHRVGTMSPEIGSFFLGMPKGFNRVGLQNGLKPNIYETFESSQWKYDMWNIPVWKHLNKYNHTLVRGISPRTNWPFLHIFLENYIDKIKCLEITESDINEMD